jgi:hypothetical protein
MSTQPCGCECQATDTVAVASQGVAFDLVMDAPEPLLPAPLFLTLMLITVALTRSHQRRRTVLPSLQLTAASPAALVVTGKPTPRVGAGRRRAPRATTDRSEWAEEPGRLHDLLNSNERAA